MERPAPPALAAGRQGFSNGAQQHASAQAGYDPAMRHPAFFSSRMVKLPMGVVGGSGVTTGWQLEEERRRNGATRL